MLQKTEKNLRNSHTNTRKELVEGRGHGNVPICEKG
jgi:hypothetical protein